MKTQDDSRVQFRVCGAPGRKIVRQQCKFWEKAIYRSIDDDRSDGPCVERGCGAPKRVPVFRCAFRKLRRHQSRDEMVLVQLRGPISGRFSASRLWAFRRTFRQSAAQAMIKKIRRRLTGCYFNNKLAINLFIWHSAAVLMRLVAERCL